MKKFTLQLVAALLTFAAGSALSLLWLTSHLDEPQTPILLVAHTDGREKDVPESEMIPLLEGWKSLKVKSELTLKIPPNMKSGMLIGDSSFHREAYDGEGVHLIIVHGDPTACDTPPYLLERSTFKQSQIELAGRKVKLEIDRFYPDFIIANACFMNINNDAAELNIAAFCKDERALDVAQTIFKSVRFNSIK